jgi:hypothetical protein
VNGISEISGRWRKAADTGVGECHVTNLNNSEETLLQQFQHGSCPGKGGEREHTVIPE